MSSGVKLISDLVSWTWRAVLEVAGSEQVRQWIQDKGTKETKAERMSFVFLFVEKGSRIKGMGEIWINQ
jgi:hypothetical protein